MCVVVVLVVGVSPPSLPTIYFGYFLKFSSLLLSRCDPAPIVTDVALKVVMATTASLTVHQVVWWWLQGSEKHACSDKTKKEEVFILVVARQVRQPPHPPV